MIILKTKIRGAIGFKRGLGLEEIDKSLNKPSAEIFEKFGDKEWFQKINEQLDFSFGPGLIALCGDNGAGKTTFLELSQPFPTLLSRDGILPDHFYLKDSLIYNIYEHCGDIIERKILIDGITKKYEAFFYKNGECLNKDGGITSYKKEVIAHFGSKELFVNSVFIAQDSDRVADMKSNGLRSLFYEVQNLKNYEVYHEINKKLLNGDKEKREQLFKDIYNSKIAGLTNNISDTDKMAFEQNAKIDAQREAYQQTKGCYEEQTRLGGEIATLKATLEKIIADPEGLKNQLLEKTSLELSVKKLAEESVSVTSEIESLRENITRLEEKIIQNQDLIADKLQKEKILSETLMVKNNEILGITTERETKLNNFEVYNEHTPEIEKIKQKYEAETQSLQQELSTITERKKRLDTELAENEKSLEDAKQLKLRTEKIVDKKELILENINKRQEHQSKINQLLTEESPLHSQKSELQQKESDLTNSINIKNQELLSKQYDKKSVDEKLEAASREISKIEAQTNYVEGLSSEIKGLLTVSSGLTEEESTGLIGNIQALEEQSKSILEDFRIYEEHKNIAGTQILEKIHDFKQKIAIARPLFIQKIGLKFQDSITGIAARIEAAEQKLISESSYNNEAKLAEYKKLKLEFFEKSEELSGEIESLNLAIEELKANRAKLQPEISEINKRLLEISSEIKENSAAIVEINKIREWDKLKKELDEAEKTLSDTESKISSLTMIINEKQITINELITSKHNIQNHINDKQKTLNDELGKIDNLIRRDKENLNLFYEQKIASVEEKYSVKIADLNAEIELLKTKIDNTIDERKAELTSRLSVKEERLSSIQKEITESQEKLNILSQTISDLQASLNQKQMLNDQIVGKEAELQLVEREIKDYTFLGTAFDKTGIPVLKLEHSLNETQVETNDLLALFGSKYRVKFPTQKATKDGKKMTEDLGAKVIDEEFGEMDLKNNSGGEKRWIDPAIKLGIREIYRKKGDKNIQTSVLDESDDGLTEKNAEAYLQMVDIAHRKSNIFQTFIITHKTFLSDSIPQKIIFERGKGIKTVKED